MYVCMYTWMYVALRKYSASLSYYTFFSATEIQIDFLPFLQHKMHGALKVQNIFYYDANNKEDNKAVMLLNKY